MLFVFAESYSAICLPNANTHTERVLQEDNTELAYEFVSSSLLNRAYSTVY